MFLANKQGRRFAAAQLASFSGLCCGTVPNKTAVLLVSELDALPPSSRPGRGVSVGAAERGAAPALVPVQRAGLPRACLTGGQVPSVLGDSVAASPCRSLCFAWGVGPAPVL